MIPSPAGCVATVAWGVIAGLDLVSTPQGLLSRPIVAATVAGALMGNTTGGLIAGMVLELYALDVLPIGAARYPDYSVASVAGGVAGALVAAPVAAGAAALVGLPMAALGGWSILALRRRNASAVQRRLERVAAGEARAIWELQRDGFLRDALRSLALALIGLVAAFLVAAIGWERLPRAPLLSWAALAGGLAATLGGAVRSAGRGARRYWLACGIVTGLVLELAR